jgi:hypothetical protein
MGLDSTCIKLDAVRRNIDITAIVPDLLLIVFVVFFRYYFLNSAVEAAENIQSVKE